MAARDHDHTAGVKLEDDLGCSPSPWGVSDIYQGPYVVCAAHYAIAQMVKMTGEFGEERLANAHLMAAAPELLALAHSLVHWLKTDAADSYVGHDDMRVYRLDGGVLGNLLNDARAAIAKALGPQTAGESSRADPGPDNLAEKAG